MTTGAKRQAKRLNRNGATAAGLCLVVAGMGGLAFASEPLYRAFCQVTGYGGTTQVAGVTLPSERISNQMVTVQFDANVNHNLPWRFKPVQREIKVRVGERVLAFYEATNVSDTPIVGTATYNVSPYKTATFFNKIDCFCFTEQILRPGQTVQMPVTFYVDPELIKDKFAGDTKVITLSYTFYASDDQSAIQELAAAGTKSNELANITETAGPKG